MYKNFFGLRENPFNVNPDPRFLCFTPQTQKALDELTYGIRNRKGLILLTGEVGTGKTTLINCLLDWLRHRRIPTAFIFNSRLSVNHLFEFILTDFGIPIDIQIKSNMLMRLNTWLIECFRAGQSPVLIIDEAQGLSCKLLEEIRLLLNLETASEKLLQIVLAGQPELEENLKRPELRQLRQRITLRCNTGPLALEESRRYITERLRISGAMGDPIFTSDAMDAVHFYSQGIPRVINLLCEHALMNAYAEHFRPVPARMVQEAAQDFFLDEGRQFTKEEANFQAPSRATSHVELTAFDGVEESALTARNSTVTTARPREPISASIVNSNCAAEAKSKESAPSLDSIAPVSGTATPLNAEKKPSQVANLISDLLHLFRSRTEDKSSSATKCSPVFNAQDRAPTLHTTSWIPRSSHRPAIHALLRSWKPWSSWWVTGFWPIVSLAEWSRVSLVALRKISRALLRRWKCEVKSDWIALINAMRCQKQKSTHTRFTWISVAPRRTQVRRHWQAPRRRRY